MNITAIDKIIQNALEEDLTWGDVTTENLIDNKHESELVVLLKQQGVVAGLDVAERTFKLVDRSTEWQSLAKDSQLLPANTRIATIKGRSQSLLMAERVALNLLQRMSGIATLTHKYVTKAKEKSDHVRILDTRKTTPGLRYLEKYAVRMGGGFNHRYNLSDSVLIKDNHLAILQSNGQSPRNAVLELKQKIPHTVKIELEVDSLDQLREYLDLPIDTFLLDNMNCNQLTEAVKIIDGKAYTEASGGINLGNVADVAASGVDFISAGALTHSAPALDIGLDFS